MNTKNKVFHLSSCGTCRKIIAALRLEQQCELQNIKTNPISEEELDWAAVQTGSYESLFSRKAIKYREMGLNQQDLQESDYRRLILSDYSFLKRPVMFLDGTVFAGNAEKTIEAAGEKLKTVNG
ncbi:MAG: arsenate reductase family protein [Saprospiraceae bacterium]